MSVTGNTQTGVLISDSDSQLELTGELKVDQLGAVASVISIEADVTITGSAKGLITNQLIVQRLIIPTSDTTTVTNDTEKFAVNAANELLYGDVNMTTLLSGTQEPRFVYYDATGDAANEFAFSYVDTGTIDQFTISASVGSAPLQSAWCWFRKLWNRV